MPGAYEGALKFCEGNPERLGRPHFAAYLVESGFVGSHRLAFKRWLGQGKCGDVRAQWPELKETVETITASGGVAVLAHPLKYNMTMTKLKRLIAEFKLAGGRAIEVISAGQNVDKTRQLIGLCQSFELHASGGSDFHDPATRWCQLGRIPPLPKACQPVWELILQ